MALRPAGWLQLQHESQQIQKKNSMCPTLRKGQQTWQSQIKTEKGRGLLPKSVQVPGLIVGTLCSYGRCKTALLG